MAQLALPPGTSLQRRPQNDRQVQQLIQRFMPTLQEGGSVAPLLPFIFNLRSQPYSLNWSHFMFEPFFKMKNVARRMMLMCGRQVSKSTSQAASQILRARIQPDYNILTVMPLYEQVRKFSHNYVRPFIVASPIRHKLVGDLKTDSVLQRSLGNRSTLYYSYSSGDPSRVRGIPADEIDCLAAGTPVTMADGSTRQVEYLQAGDQILSCSERGITSNEVSRVVMQGVRPVWRLSLASGDTLEVSDHEIIATESGWCCVADLIAAAADPGHIARRREHVQNRSTSALPGSSGGASTRVSDGEVPGSQGAGTHATQTAREPRSRVHHLGLHHSDDRAVRADLGAVLPGREEAGNGSVAGTADPGGAGLGLDGRRPLRSDTRGAEHAGLLARGEPADSVLVDLDGVRRFSVERAGKVLVCTAVPRRTTEAGRAAESVRRRLDALQDPAHSSPSDADLSELWDGVPGQEQPGRWGERCLRLPRLLTLAGASAQPAAHGTVREPRDEELAHAGALPAEPRGRTRSRSGEAATRSQRPGAAREAVGVSQGVAEAPLRAAEVTGIEYIGEKPVYDVCLRENHTLFAANVLVRNCDEMQDMDVSDLPVIEQCMGASRYKIVRYTGTPKTFDNTAHLLWEDSSQAHWYIPCLNCRHENRCVAGAKGDEGDLLNMLGDLTLVCAKCGKPVDSRIGFWVHDYPERQLTFAGYHVPQPILPMHYESPPAWTVLKEIQRDKPAYIFFNEVLGESYDIGAKIITKQQVEDACVCPPLQPGSLRFEASRYPMTALGIDWGGRGKEKPTDSDDFISNTAMALAGITADGCIDIRWLHKVPYTIDSSHEPEMAVNVAAEAQCDWVALDYGGQGNVQENAMRALGWPRELTCPFTYCVASPRRPIVFYEKPAHGGVRSSYSLDKPRSILLLCELIKRGVVRLPAHQPWLEDHLRDFLHIYEEVTENPRGSPTRLVKRSARRTDDIVHAINFACMALFHRANAWPKMAEAFIDRN